MRLKTKAERMLAVQLAIGSAHAGERLTPEAMFERLKDPDFRARYNGPIPSVVVFPDVLTAEVAARFEAAAKGGKR